MNALVKLLAMSVDFAADFILIALKIHFKIVGSVLKDVAYICQQFICFATTVAKGVQCALNDLITFLLEFGHWILIILETACGCVAFLLRIISQVYEAFFNGIVTLCSFILSVCSSLREQALVLAETLHHFTALIISSCLLFVQTVPIFITNLLKISIILIMETLKGTINSVSNGVSYAINVLNCFMIKTYATVRDIPTDFYIGVILLSIMCVGFQKMWQRYQLNGVPQFIFVLPRLFIIMIHGTLRKFHLCTQWLFSYGEIIEEDDEPTQEDEPANADFEHIDDANDGVPQFQEENVSVPSSSGWLQRKPLESLRNRQTDSNEENEVTARILMEELERERDHKLCIICQDRTKNIILLPCRHLCMCSLCYRNVLLSTNVCPLCRHEIYDYMHVFF